MTKDDFFCKNDAGKVNMDGSYTTALALLSVDDVQSLLRACHTIVDGIVVDFYPRVLVGVNMLAELVADLGSNIALESQPMCEHGAEKYGFGNYYADGVDIGRYAAAMMRHAIGTKSNPGIFMLQDIDAVDSESGNTHLQAVAANALIILELMYLRCECKHNIENSRTDWKEGYFKKQYKEEHGDE